MAKRPKMIGFLVAAALAGIGWTYWSRNAQVPLEEGATGIFQTSRKTDPIQELGRRVSALENQVRALQAAPGTGRISSSLAAPGSTLLDAPSPVSNQAAEFSHDQASDWANHWSKKVSQFDQNGDGKISAVETEFTPENFNLMDTDHNGQLDEREAKRFQQFLEQAQDYLKKREKNGDGSFPIEKREFDGPEQEFSYVDRDRDGSASEQEYIRFIQEARAQRERFDVDRDGRLSASELGINPERFKRMDNDGDGSIALWEIRRAMYKGVW